MRFKVVFHIVGLVNMILSLVMLAPLLVSLFFDDGDTWVFLVSFLITSISGLLLYFLCRTSLTNLSHRLGFLVVAASWISASIFSSLPLVLSGAFPSALDAVFVAVSGLTTTGAGVMTDLESLPHSILFWRLLTHWVGGMGIVILGLAILPLLGVGGMQIYKAEGSAVMSDKLAPRVKGMARILVTVYLLLSFTLLVFYLVAGMNLFDAVTHTFSTIATGGFSTRGASIGAYNNFTIEFVTMVFMVLGATNFALHYRFYHEGIKGYLRNSEFKFYLLILAAATVVIALNIWGSTYDGVLESLRYSSFQVVSIMTTTGYSTADYGSWPVFSQGVLMLLMFIGGSAGSTTGAIKCIRVLLLVKIGHREIYKLIHPHAVRPVKLNGKPIDQDVLNAVMGFTFMYLAVFVVSSALISLDGHDFVTAISSAAAAISNVGPALGTAGPAESFGHFSPLSKCVLIADMLLGRLELYTLLILFVPAFWRG